MESEGRDSGRLAGKVAVVTGAGSSPAGVGIGDAIALLFAREGAVVCLVDRDHARAVATQAQVQAASGVADVVVADVTSAVECRRVVQEVSSLHGRLDVLVNNVGTGGGDQLDTLEEEEWDRVISVNLKSVAMMTKAAVPLLEIEGGAIVNIASTGGIISSGSGVSGASKAGVIMSTRDAAVAYGRRGIRANSIAPGHLHTPFIGELSDKLRAERAEIAPLGIEGDAFDVARAALFLAGEESRFITGTCLPVDGGVTIVSPIRAHRWLEA
jgi:NAD(P)-dependent dehydrogenase (short-subunit alcohol dehydrogenase family)